MGGSPCTFWSIAKANRELDKSGVIRGTQGNGDCDDYGFLLSEWLLLKIIFGYIHEQAVDYEMNFKTALEMIKIMEIDGELPDYKTAVDYTFEAMEERDPLNSTALKYKYFKTTPYAKNNRLLDSCAERLAPLVTKEALDLLSQDELCFDELPYRKTALFVGTNENCSHLKFITPLMYSQFFSMMYEQINI
jgi:type IV secretion system protein VirD4